MSDGPESVVTTITQWLVETFRRPLFPDEHISLQQEVARAQREGNASLQNIYHRFRSIMACGSAAAILGIEEKGDLLASPTLSKRVRVRKGGGRIEVWEPDPTTTIAQTLTPEGRVKRIKRMRKPIVPFWR